MPVGLQRRDSDLLEVLTRRVRILSLTQIAHTWWRSPQGATLAARRLHHLHGAGWITFERWLAREEVPLRDPMVCWQPGDDAPAFDALAHRLSKRWQAPAALTLCAVATAAAGERFQGQAGRIPRQSEVTHDLHLGGVFLRMREELPTRARSWRSEDAPSSRAPHGEKRPDAFVTDGRYRTAIELAGNYGADKLKAFHAHCAARDLAYELW